MLWTVALWFVRVISDGVWFVPMVTILESEDECMSPLGLLAGVDCRNSLGGTGIVPDSLVDPSLTLDSLFGPGPAGFGQELLGPDASQPGALPDNDGRDGEENFQLIGESSGRPKSSTHVNSNAAEAMGETGDSSGKTAKVKGEDSPQGNGNGNGNSRDQTKNKKQGSGRKLRFIDPDVDDKNTRDVLLSSVF